MKARRHLEIAVSIDDHDCDKRYELGRCLLQNGNPDGAIEQLNIANSMKPGVDYVLDKLAQAFIAKGDKAKAEEIYCAIPENRRRGFILKNLGSLYLGLGKPDKALPLLKNAAARDQKSYKVHFYLGQALESAGQLKAARQAYSKAAELRKKLYNKDFPDATARIEKLDLTLLEKPEINQPDDKGIIEFYDSKRGYGFIRTEAGEKIFFHITAILQKEIACVGTSVTFECCQTERGVKAIKVYKHER